MSKISDYIRQNVIPKELNQGQVADLLGVHRQSVSRLLNGKVKLSDDMAFKLQREFKADAETLLQIQREEQSVSYNLANHSVTKNLYRISANDIEHYFSSEKEGQDTLPILIRKLVRAENKHLTEFDFPGGNNSQRHGTDGYTHAKQGTNFVPEGYTVWEFGTNRQQIKKANEDFTNRTKDDSESACEKRLEQTYIFVTSKNWRGGKNWAKSKKEEAEFKNVRCYDASSLEQWLEGHPLVQIWFAEIRGIDTLGLATLEQSWKHWSSICDPVLSPKLYENSVVKFVPSFLRWAKDPTDRIFNIQGNTREEVKAFFGAAKVLTSSLPTNQDKQLKSFSRWNLTDDHFTELINLLDRCVIVSDNTDAGRLAVSDADVIPISVTPKSTENCLAAFPERKIIVGFDNDVSRGDDPHFRIDKSSFDKFQDAMDEMGISYSKSEIISHATNKSPLLIRRYLASTPDLKKPSWCERLRDNLDKIVPIFLLGAMKSENGYDLWMLEELSYECCESTGKRLLRFWRGLSRDEDSPIRQRKNRIGIHSPLECIAFLGHLLDGDILDCFFTLCWRTFSAPDAISGEVDNSAQLRFEPSSRKPSNLLKGSLANTIALMAEHGETHFSGHIRPTISLRIQKFINELLSNSSLQDMFALRDYLPNFAEAAPEAFLSKIEEAFETIQSSLSVCKTDSEERYDLIDLLERIIQCLEIVAWHKSFVERVCLILARLSRIGQIITDVDQDANWLESYSITPEDSLEQILRQYRPCTSASEETRVHILRRLYCGFPDIGFRLAIKEADGTMHFVHDTTKPDFREWANKKEQRRSVVCKQPYLDTCFQILINHSYTNLIQIRNLVEVLEWFPRNYEQELLTIIDRWLDSATRSERVEIFDQLRQLAIKNNETAEQTVSQQESDNTKFDLKLLGELIRPKSIIEQHAWLFIHDTVDRSNDEFRSEDGTPDIRAMQEDTERLQRKAMQDIWSRNGSDGFIDLLECCRTSHLPSSVLMKLNLTDQEIAEIILGILDKLDQVDIDHVYHTVLQFALSNILNKVKDLVVVLPIVLDKIELMKSEVKTESLLKQLPVSHNVLSILRNRGQNLEYENFYWKYVKIADYTLGDANIEQYIESLLEAKRCKEAVTFLGTNLNEVEAKSIADYLRRVSDSLPNSFRSSPKFQGILYDCMVKISKSKVSTNELADLEFLYADVLLLGGTEYSIPTLIKLSREDPKVFFSLVAGCSCRKDSVQDRKKFRFWDMFDSQTKVSEQCYAILTPINYVFGDHESMVPFDRDEAITWVEKVIELAERHDRKELAFHHIGIILGKITRDRNEMFPHEVARALFEKFRSNDLTEGWKIGFDNNGPGESSKTYSVSGRNSSSLSNQYQTKADEWAEEFECSSILMSKMADFYRNKELGL